MTAPAWPVKPPPLAFTSTCTEPLRLVRSSMPWMFFRSRSSVKKMEISLPFTLKEPLPAFTRTRATAVLRRPVPQNHPWASGPRETYGVRTSGVVSGMDWVLSEVLDEKRAFGERSIESAGVR